MKKAKVVTKDLEGPFEAMKKFKTEFPETENDIAFKTSYTRLRKFVKKLKKIYEVEIKAKKSEKELTQDQKDMIETKRDNELLFEEVLLFCNSYMEEYRKKENDGNTKKAQEESKANESQESVKNQATAQALIDVENIKQEEYARGFGEGKQDGYKSGRRDGFEDGRKNGYEQGIKENPPHEPEDPTEVLRKAAKYSTILMVLPVWMSGMQFYDPSFKLGEYFSEDEINLAKEMYAPTQPYFAPSFKMEKLVETGLLDAFERVTKNSKFMSVVQQTMPFTSAYMMNFGAYNPNLTGMMGGQSLMGMQNVMPAATQSYSAPQVEVPKQVTKSAEPEKVTQTATVVSVVFDEVQVDSEEAKGASQEHVTTDNVNEIWNQHDEDDDEEEEPEHDSGDENKDNQEAKTTEEQFFDEEGHKKGYHGQKNYHDKSVHTRYGRGGGHRGGRYRAHYNDYNPKDYQAYDSTYAQQSRDFNSRGGYHTYKQTNNYYAGPEAAVEGGDQQHETRDFYNKPRRGGRGAPRRAGRGSRGHKFEEHHHHHEQEVVKTEAPKYDDDGFEIINKKTYVMPKNKGKKKRTAPAQQN